MARIALDLYHVKPSSMQILRQPSIHKTVISQLTKSHPINLFEMYRPSCVDSSHLTQFSTPAAGKHINSIPHYHRTSLLCHHHHHHHHRASSKLEQSYTKGLEASSKQLNCANYTNPDRFPQIVVKWCKPQDEDLLNHVQPQKS